LSTNKPLLPRNNRKQTVRRHKNFFSLKTAFHEKNDATLSPRNMQPKYRMLLLSLLLVAAVVAIAAVIVVGCFDCGH
jgi:hypothetical protein